MSFAPQADEELVIGTTRFTFARGKRGKVFVNGAGRADIYKLQDPIGKFGPCALKVHKETFREGPHVARAVALDPLTREPGVQAAARRVLTQGRFQGHSDLVNAVVMPFMPGDTLVAMLGRAAEARECPWRPESGLRRAAAFLRVVAALEERGITHSDLSPGNVMLVPAGMHYATDEMVELLDLDDVWGRLMPEQASLVRYGSPGYQLPAGRGTLSTACAAGDRFAALVIATELIALGLQATLPLVTEDGIVLPHVPGAGARVEQIQRAAPDGAAPILRALADAFRPADRAQVLPMREAATILKPYAPAMHLVKAPPKLPVLLVSTDAPPSRTGGKGRKGPRVVTVPNLPVTSPGGHAITNVQMPTTLRPQPSSPANAGPTAPSAPVQAATFAGASGPVDTFAPVSADPSPVPPTGIQNQAMSSLRKPDTLTKSFVMSALLAMSALVTAFVVVLAVLAFS